MSDEDHEDSDPVEKMLKQAGCLELHYKIQMCIADTKDWRKCQTEVKDFKECMEKYQKNLRKEQ